MYFGHCKINFVCCGWRMVVCIFIYFYQSEINKFRINSSRCSSKMTNCGWYLQITSTQIIRMVLCRFNLVYTQFWHFFCCFMHDTGWTNLIQCELKTKTPKSKLNTSCPFFSAACYSQINIHNWKSVRLLIVPTWST